MNPTLNAILYVITLPLKPPLFLILWVVDLIWFKTKFSVPANQGRTPNLSQLQVDFAQLLTELPGPNYTVQGPRGALYKMGSGDQALRQGSLCWATRDPGFISGMANFVLNGQFIRGYNGDGTPNLSPPGPAMPGSVAFAIAVALRNNVPISEGLKQAFLAGVDTQITQDFTESDVSSAPRVTTTAFDVLYVSSLTLAAFKISGDTRYRDSYRKMMWWHFGWLLLLVPYAFPPSNRKFFIEHVLMFLGWTSVELAPCFVSKFLFKHSMKMVYLLSQRANQPYFAALLDEQAGVSDSARSDLLDAHADISLPVHCEFYNLTWDATKLFGYVTFSDSEYTLDMNPAGYPTRTGAQQGFIIVSGLAMGRSLFNLMKATPSNEEIASPR